MALHVLQKKNKNLKKYYDQKSFHLLLFATYPAEFYKFEQI